MKSLGEAFRFAARLQYATGRTNGVVENPQELEKGMINYLKTEYGEEVDLAMDQFKSSEAYEHLAQTMNNLNTSSENSSARLADA